jgi:UDP-N-acetylmuramate--alanine ligase
MNLEAVKYVYLLGAGGIGMSALGRYFLRRGIPVKGYDRTSVPLTDALQAEGMDLTFEDRNDHIPASWILPENRDALLVIYTPAIPQNHGQKQYLAGLGIPLFKRAQVLGMISAAHRTLAVAGTHGKTTTSTLVAHILQVAGKTPVAFLGGISTNYNTNYLEGHKDAVMVVEADEYDRSFLQLHPDASVLTSTDPDHLDIYGDSDSIRAGFAEFIARVEKPQMRVIRQGLELPESITHGATRYAIEGPADVYATDIRLEGDRYRFTLVLPEKRWADMELGLPGLHNLENAIGAAALCALNGISENAIREALQSFKGVKRRFEYILRTPECVFIDDYAHHPAELKACIQSVKALYPGKALTGIFQPHLYSRTRDFYDGFAESLSLLDRVILLDIYPARELPITGVSSLELLQRIRCTHKELVSKTDLPGRIAELKPEVLLTLGAGDIDALVQPIAHQLTRNT